MSNNATEFSVTLVNAASGQSENLPVSPTTLLSELAEWAVALFGINANASQPLHFFKDGKRIVHATSLSLQAAGIQSGDVLAVQQQQQQQQQQQRAPRSGGGGGGSRSAAPTAASGGGGGLDFSSLLAGVSAPSPAAAGGASGGGGGGDDSTVPVYFPGMHLMDAMEYNPHPRQFCSLLQTKEHLFKELRYHDPQTAAKLQNKSLEEAMQIWRENCVRGGISQAMKQTNAFHERQDMEKRLQNDPNDEIAKAYFAKHDAKKKVQQQYLEMMNEYPESLGRVLMLYVEAKINGHAIQAFCDTGAQITIISKRIAKECGLRDYIDDRFAGMATGVGTGKILGKIHILQLQIGTAFFPCSVSVMDDPAPGATEMPFLLGLDMMKRHVCSVNLQKGVLQFPLAGVEIPFLHEKDLGTEQGGTRGFDANKANQEVEEFLRKEQEEEKGGSSSGDGEDKKEKPDVAMDESK